MSRRDPRVPILYLAPWVDLGGSDKGTIDWFRHIDRTRFAPSLITTQPSPNRWLSKVEPYAEEIWDLPDLMPGASYPAFILGFIESRGVKVVHIMNSRLGYDLLPDMTCLPEPPAVVVQLHAEEPDKSGYVRYSTRRYGNLVDAFSVTSEQLRDAVASYDIPPSRVEVIYTGVDAEKEFNPEHVDPLELSGNGTPRILWPGRLVDQKDPLLTLDVLAQVRARGADFVLDVVGDGELAPVALERARKLGLADSICWHPPALDMAPWYRSADLLLMTSVFEGVPYVIYESLAMGVPVVAPALPGNREFMDSDSGALVDPRDDVHQYADAVTALLSDPVGRRAMGDRSRERMLSDFSLAEMGHRHGELYDRLLANPRGRTATAPPSADARAEPPPHASELFARDPLPPRSVGVIVPCHRHGIYLDECIGSIKAQTLQPTAIVVVDDGSTDPETVEALERLDADPAVTVLRQSENLGPSAARNKALAELDTAYVLPLDADDKLLPDAIERLVAQLEGAPEHVGFVYPNAQHAGNRADYIASPAYNLWLLMGDNYCPAPALFDRRAFEAGAAYPEDMVFGHEDWDLLLQMAELGIHGVHAEGPTFLYRKYGFSRINAVEYGPLAFHKSVELRHPALYRNRAEMKSRWAPALSVVLLEDGDERWRAADLAKLPAQSCADFELLAARDLGDGIWVADSRDDSPTGRLQACIAAARGRWVCVVAPRALPALRDPSLVERTIHCFWAHARTAGVVLAEAGVADRAAFAQLTDTERLDARPVAFTFERVPEQPTPPVELGLTGSLLAELVLNMQTHGPIQWRVAPREHLVAAGHANGNGKRRNGRPAATGDAAHGSERRAPFLMMDRRPPHDAGEAWVQRAVSWQEPLLPKVTDGVVRRWENAAGWNPPETIPLCRHRALDRDDWVVTNSRQPPPGYRLEFDLGVVHRYAFPGTRRLVEAGENFTLTDEENELTDSRSALGFVEQVPLPMLNVLELRRAPDSGKTMLVAGPDDPLFNWAEAVRTLGWIEAFPILPRCTPLHVGPWGGIALRRYVDGWRHRYRTGERNGEAESVALGSLLREPGDALVELRLRQDGRVESDYAAPSRLSVDPLLAGRWTLAPLAWEKKVPPPAWAQRAAGSRLRHLARCRTRARAREREQERTLGWLRRNAATGYSPLVSATHPVTGDQLLTRSELEATELGYRIDGVLGHVFDAGTDHADALAGTAVLWGSRFGRGRRYVEGTSGAS
jgi:glycosyltransferase involved in cell wall biosynthesis